VFLYFWVEEWYWDHASAFKDVASVVKGDECGDFPEFFSVSNDIKFAVLRKV
jgi:hypothetical protein